MGLGRVRCLFFFFLKEKAAIGYERLTEFQWCPLPFWRGGCPGATPGAPARARLVPPGTPGRLTLQGLPAGARVTLNGGPFRGSQGEVPPNVYKLAVQEEGYAALQPPVIVRPGPPLTGKADTRPSRGPKVRPREQY